MPSATPTTSTCRRSRRLDAAAAPPRDGRDSRDTLTRHLVERDDRAVAELYRRYGGRILGLALNVLGDRHLAEEAVQETILRVWRRSDTFDATRELEPWLFRIARNTAYDMARARQRRPRPQRGDPDRILDDRTDPDDAFDPPRATEGLALRWEVRRALDSLPEIERDVVRLQHLGGLSHREIASRLGISVGTVKSRSHRAHRRLADALGDVRQRGVDAA